MGTHVLSLRVDGELLERLRGHAAKRGMSVQDYVIGTLVRDDFDERFQSAVEETERFYAGADGDTAGEPAGHGGPDGETVPLSRAATGTTVAGTGTLSMTALRAASATDPAAPSDPAHPADLMGLTGPADPARASGPGSAPGNAEGPSRGATAPSSGRPAGVPVR
ncbi:hypothetical protein OG924_20670 [Streptomyces uncialis]|nr:hypothetical protein OG924_20670 [Streptomyces uncialis]